MGYEQNLRRIVETDPVNLFNLTSQIEVSAGAVDNL